MYQEGRTLDDGYYRMKDRATGKYLNSRTMKFETLEGDGDSTAFIWHYTWLDDMERYKIQNHNDSAYLNNEGALTDRVYSKARSSFYLYTLVGGRGIGMLRADTGALRFLLLGNRRRDVSLRPG